MKRAVESSPPQPVSELQLCRRSVPSAVALRSMSARVMLALGLAALASAPALAQRGGATQSTAASSHLGAANNASGSHLSEGSRIGNNAHFTSAANSSAPPESPKRASGETRLTSASVQSESLLAGSTSVAPPAPLHLESAQTETPWPLRAATVYPQKVVIGFPPASPESGIPSGTVHEGRAVVTGQRNEFWVEAPQRGAVPHGGAAPQHAGAPIRSAPITTARPIHAPPAPIGGVRFSPPIRPSSTIRPRSSFSFLQRPLATSPPRVFGPRRGRPRFFGGLGFFPFGFAFPFFDFGFASDCNPFWAWPWAYGCETFGYWNGYNEGFIAGYNAGPEEQEMEQQPEVEQPPEELGNYMYVPPREPSSPEEIEAEKVLFVLYMKNGAVYAVTNYWVGDGKLHYLTSYGGENTIDLNDLDVQKTVDVNASRGVEFTLKPAPDQKQQNPQPRQDQLNPPDLQN
jgi:hypothetical protein